MSEIEVGSSIIIGLVAPIGVNLDLVNKTFENAINNYGYDSQVIQLANLGNLIQKEQTIVKDPRVTLDYKNVELGKLRQNLAKSCLDGLSSYSIYASLFIKYLHENRSPKTIYIIDSLKRPEEVSLLRAIYGKSFFLVGVTSSYESKLLQKEKELEGEDNAKELAKSLVDDDHEKNKDKIDEQGDEHKFDNKTHKTFLASDLFLYLDQHSESILQPSIERFVDIIFGAENITPTPEEHYMFLAYMSSLKSADLSRQVGSAIVNTDNDIIAMGANDVPKFGGGSYWPDEPYKAFIKEGFDGSLYSDQRDYILGKDKNAEEKSNIIESIVESIKQKITIENEKELINAIENSKLSDITEYGRAVHAEMAAIMSAAKNGIAVKDAIMYCTTYPCHNCAKHIVASGIKKVVYIEPYSKSKAIDSHCDSIKDQKVNSVDNDEKVAFTSFSGIAPRLYQDFFSMKHGDGRSLKRKENDGVAIYLTRNLEKPLRIAVDKDVIELKETRHITDLVFEGVLDRKSSGHDEEILNDENNVDRSKRIESKIKFWLGAKEYGCITKTGDYENDYFFNISNLKDESVLDKLEKGIEVSFKVKDGAKKGVKFADEIEVLID